MIGRYRRTGEAALAEAVGRLELGGRRDTGIDHRVVDWAQGSLPEPAEQDVEARLHDYLEQAAALGHRLARRRCELWLLASAGVLAALVVFLAT